jgi:phosphomannomutase/phosphoglucomutase
MHPKAFREYDIRGVVGEDILDHDVQTLGRTFGAYMSRQGKRRVVVGRDCRLSSERYRDLLLEGMLAAGLDVIDVGVCPSPLLYFAIRHLDREGGVRSRPAITPLNTTVSRCATGMTPFRELKSRSCVT